MLKRLRLPWQVARSRFMLYMVITKSWRVPQSKAPPFWNSRHLQRPSDGMTAPLTVMRGSTVFAARTISELSLKDTGLFRQATIKIGRQTKARSQKGGLYLNQIPTVWRALHDLHDQDSERARKT